MFEILLSAIGRNRSKITSSSGNVIFNFLSHATYFIYIFIPFLQPPPVPTIASPDSRLQDYETPTALNTPKQIFRKALEKTIQLRDSTDGSTSQSTIKQMPATIKLGKHFVK